MKNGAMMALSTAMSLSVDMFNDFELTEETQRFLNGGLTDKEIEEGYFIDDVLGKCNISKALDQRNKAIRREYEAFRIMHKHDGSFTESDRFSRL